MDDGALRTKRKSCQIKTGKTVIRQDTEKEKESLRKRFQPCRFERSEKETPMRRPLLIIIAGFVFVLRIVVLLYPWSPEEYESFRSRRICLTGTVSSLEPRLEGDTVVWQMLLSDIKAGSPLALRAGSTNEPPYIIESPCIIKKKTDLSAGSRPGITQNITDKTGKRNRVLCILDEEPSLDMSARVLLKGKVYPFRRAFNEGGFDVRLYYHILRIDFSLRDVDLLAVSAPADRTAASLYRFKRSLSAAADQVFSPRNAPLVKAVLLGEKGLLQDETRDLYQGAGIIHIISISGLHLSLIGMGIFNLLGKLHLPVPETITARKQTENKTAYKKYKKRGRGFPLVLRGAIAAAAVFFYGKMVGMGTSVLRALVMLTLYLVSKIIGRTYDLMTAAAAAAILLLADQPLYLLHTGFLFSFGAVLSIGILMPALPGRVLKILAVPLGTLPVYLWMNGTFPLCSLLLNLVVIPLMPLVMVSAAMAVLVNRAGCAFLSGNTSWLAVKTAGLAGMAARTARLAGLPAELILNLYRFLAETSEKLPFHEIVTGRPAGIQVILYIIMLLFLTGVSVFLQMPYVRKRIERADHPSGAGTDDRGFGASDMSGQRCILAVKRICTFLRLRDNMARRRFAVFCSAGWILLCLIVLGFRVHPAFEMDVLCVGQGDGIYITAGGRHFFIDGGSSTENELERYTLLPFLHCRGVSVLDGVILTHDDIDHCSGLLSFLQSDAEGKRKIKIRTVYLPEIAEGSRGGNYLQIEELAERTGTQICYISRGQQIRSGKLRMICLHPEKGAGYETANAGSTTLLLLYDDFSAILTGDLEGTGEQALVDYLKTEAAGSSLRTGKNRNDKPEQVSILKVAHHGSRNSTGEDFLKMILPEAAVISAGKNNLYGHPHRELLQRLLNRMDTGQIYRTDQNGEILIQKRRRGYSIKVFCPDGR